MRPAPVDMLISGEGTMSVLLWPLAALLDGEALVVSDVELRKYIGRTIRMTPVGPDSEPDASIILELVPLS